MTAPLSVYVHVPFCAVRCGYCDFNTYTKTDLGGGGAQELYASNAVAEMRMQAADDAAAGLGNRPASTVFFGGGTPTLLPVDDLITMLDGIRETTGLADDVEVTTEANPDSVDAEALERLAEAGFTRVSFGMQSAVPQVLQTLDRTHDPERVPRVVEWAKRAGLQSSLDLIYGTPGESVADFETSIAAAVAEQPDHVSAYALVIEGNTAMARQLRRGEIPPVDEDEQAAKYEIADALLSEAGYHWYEVSNWSTSRETRCRHNLAYWQDHDWWGIGPGAHAHRGSTRSWNVKHPSAYAQRIAAGELPVKESEALDEDARYLERLLLGIRLADGFPVAELRPTTSEGERADDVLARWETDGALEPAARADGRMVLTLRGRLLADGMVRDLV